jgi:hypothetical protein
MSNVTLFKNLNFEQIEMKKAYEDYGDLKTVFLSIRGEPIVLQLDEFFTTTPFGLSSGFGGETSTSRRKTLDLYSTPDLEKKVSELENYITRKCRQDHTLLGNPNNLELKSMVRRNKNPKYKSTVRTKLNTDRVKVVLDGGLKQGVLEHVSKNTKLKVIGKLRCLWKKDNMYGLTFDVSMILVKTEEQENYTFV